MLNVKDINKYYDSNPVLSDLSFELSTGHYILSGSNGCGKSTLLRVIAGADSEWSGQVLLNGIDLKKDFKSYVKMISFVPDNLSLFGELSVDEFSSFALKQRKLIEPSLPEELAELFKFDLSSSKSLGTLSLGNAKKLMLIIALSYDCQLYLFDEPMNGLDNLACDIFFQQLKNREDRFIVMATHMEHPQFTAQFQRIPFISLNEYQSNSL
ncbi:ABC transporter ATP-binding protein [Pleionea sediminis]|uniref:ATP-binding cassette domain-containing protein n=1 Tax=Pleionea sediminis TaxID=2569479 RepID=UPI0013DE63D8|nr:ABC transporter ATP-binding protein [Pleionea sediminis]